MRREEGCADAAIVLVCWCPVLALGASKIRLLTLPDVMIDGLPGVGIAVVRHSQAHCAMLGGMKAASWYLVYSRPSRVSVCARVSLLT